MYIIQGARIKDALAIRLWNVFKQFKNLFWIFGAGKRTAKFYGQLDLGKIQMSQLTKFGVSNS